MWDILNQNWKREMAHLTDCVLLGPITSHQSDSLARQVAASGGCRGTPRHYLSISGKRKILLTRATRNGADDVRPQRSNDKIGVIFLEGPGFRLSRNTESCCSENGLTFQFNLSAPGPNNTHASSLGNSSRLFCALLESKLRVAERAM